MFSLVLFCMKVVYFKRNARSPINIHAGYYADCFYVPDENLVLYKEQYGSFGGQDYSLTKKDRILKEARSLAKGKIPKAENVSFSDIKEFEYDSSKLLELIQNTRLKSVLELIQNTRLKSELQTKVKYGIEYLLKQSG